MRIRFGMYLALSLLSGACSLDLVDPPSDQRDAMLSVFLDARDWSVGRMIVSGALRPGVDGSGNEREVANPQLALFGTRLHPDTVYEEGRLALLWHDTLTLPDPRPDVVSLVSPQLGDGLPLDELVLPIKSALLDRPTRREWSVGEDLVLLLSPTRIDGEVAASADWQLQAQGWLESGARIHLISMHARGTAPDTLRIPGGWLPSIAVDSLEVSLQYDRVFSTTRSDSSYSSSVRLAQQFVWFFIVRRP